MFVKVIKAEVPKNAGMSERDVIDRLTDFLVKIKEKKAAQSLEIPADREVSQDELFSAMTKKGMSFEDLERLAIMTKPTYRESARIKNRARNFRDRINAKMPSLYGLKNEDEREKVIAISHGAFAKCVDTDVVETVAAELHEDMPWLADVTSFIMRRGRSCAATGQPFHLPPIIIDSGPGVGKTYFAQRLGELLDVCTSRIDLATESAFGLTGLERGWGSARPGLVVETILNNRSANPLIVVDELGRGTEVVYGTKSVLPGSYAQLLAMIEPETAKTWRCPYYQIEFDLRRVSWIMTTNGLENVPAALLSRCKVFRIPTLGPDNLRHATRILARGRLEPESAEMIAAAVFRAAKGRPRMDLRAVERAIRRAEEVREFGTLLH